MMATVLITPLRSGGAVAELSGDTPIWPDWRAAATEAERRGIPWRLLSEPVGKPDRHH